MSGPRPAHPRGSAAWALDLAVPAGTVRAGGAPLPMGEVMRTEWRAVATRYEETARSFLGVLCLAATMDWLKVAER